MLPFEEVKREPQDLTEEQMWGDAPVDPNDVVKIKGARYEKDDRSDTADGSVGLL